MAWPETRDNKSTHLFWLTCSVALGDHPVGETEIQHPTKTHSLPLFLRTFDHLRLTQHRRLTDEHFEDHLSTQLEGYSVPHPHIPGSGERFLRR